MQRVKEKQKWSILPPQNHLKEIGCLTAQNVPFPHFHQYFCPSLRNKEGKGCLSFHHVSETLLHKSEFYKQLKTGNFDKNHRHF